MTNEKMGIAWLSNAPWSTTGYGTQTKATVPRIVSELGYPVSVIAFFGLQGSILPWIPGPETKYDPNLGPLPIYPSYVDSWGADIAAAHASFSGSKILISLMDIWVLNMQKLALEQNGVFWCPWFPVDCEPLPPGVYERARQAHKLITFSRFGQRVVQEAGLDAAYVPHAIDTELYKPYPQKQVREELGLPQDRFIIGMVAANKGNPSRKAFTEQMLAFKLFKEDHPEALMYLHTTTGEGGEFGGEALLSYANALGLSMPDDIRFTEQYFMTLGQTEEFMAKLYSSFDVLTNVSKGEGFGLTILEAQACGTPVVTGDWTSMSEITFAGWKHEKSRAQPWWYPLQAWQYIPNPGIVHELYEDAYKELSNPQNKVAIRSLARERALEYDVYKIINENWKPVLEEIQDSLTVFDNNQRTVEDIISSSQIPEDKIIDITDFIQADE